MSQTLEAIPTMSATQRYIEIAKREDPDRWERAYALRDAVNEHLPERVVGATTLGDDGVNTGLHQAIAEVWEEATDAGLVEGDTDTLRKDYRTAVAWPEETRVEGATYPAHFILRDLDNRQGKLSKWVAQTRTGYFGERDARRKKSELGRSASERVEEARPPARFRKNVERALNRWGTGGGLETGERREAISILQDLISEIEAGSF